jgi:acyl carrier protein
MLLDLGAQSFDFVDLVMRLEKRYEIDIALLYTIPDRHTVASYVKAVREGRSTRDEAPRPVDLSKTVGQN